MKTDTELNAFLNIIKDISKQNEKDINHDKKLTNNLTNKYF